MMSKCLRRFCSSPASPWQSDGVQRGQPPTGEGWVKQLDPDGDGKASKSEFKVPPDLKVSTLDKNGDHYISTDEGHQRSASPPRRSWRSERLISLPHPETLTCLRKFLLFFAVSQSSTR
jgi:hypothetical protein